MQNPTQISHPNPWDVAASKWYGNLSSAVRVVKGAISLTVLTLISPITLVDPNWKKHKLRVAREDLLKGVLGTVPLISQIGFRSLNNSKMTEEFKKYISTIKLVEINKEINILNKKGELSNQEKNFLNLLFREQNLRYLQLGSCRKEFNDIKFEDLKIFINNSVSKTTVIDIDKTVIDIDKLDIALEIYKFRLETTDKWPTDSLFDNLFRLATSNDPLNQTDRIDLDALLDKAPFEEFDSEKLNSLQKSLNDLKSKNHILTDRATDCLQKVEEELSFRHQEDEHIKGLTFELMEAEYNRYNDPHFIGDARSSNYKSKLNKHLIKSIFDDIQIRRSIFDEIQPGDLSRLNKIVNTLSEKQDSDRTPSEKLALTLCQTELSGMALLSSDSFIQLLNRLKQEQAALGLNELQACLLERLKDIVKNSILFIQESSSIDLEKIKNDLSSKEEESVDLNSLDVTLLNIVNDQIKIRKEIQNLLLKEIDSSSTNKFVNLSHDPKYEKVCHIILREKAPEMEALHLYHLLSLVRAPEMERIISEEMQSRGLPKSLEELYKKMGEEMVDFNEQAMIEKYGKQTYEAWRRVLIYDAVIENEPEDEDL